jgi:FKBP-type peptidyl-prolyl cis-trans isomerase FkpA/FKBP-type peptidyl-prolyl cis-trans isomerase FklB
MKKILTSLLVVGLVFAVGGCQKGAADKKELKTETEKVSYAIGMDIGNSLKRLDADIDTNALRQGVQDVLKGEKTLMTQEEVMKTMQEFAKNLQASQEQKTNEKAAKNLEEGKKFLEENAKKEGVTTTKSGLQYQVITEGKGPKPKGNDRVSVHYKGTLLDGTTFDSSYDRGQPATFPLNAVIPGWTEGVQLMSVGSKYKLWIPAELGYGERGAGPKIGPNATLTFEVELLSIENSPAAATAPAAPKGKK